MQAVVAIVKLKTPTNDPAALQFNIKQIRMDDGQLRIWIQSNDDHVAAVLNGSSALSSGAL